MRQAVPALLVVGIALAACTDDRDSAAVVEQPRVTTIAEGMLTACVATDPTLAEDAAGGVGGFDLAVLEAVADELQVPLDVVATSLDELVSGVALNSGTCDVAAGGVVDRAELDGVVTTSAPYRTVHHQLVAQASGPEVAPAEVTGRIGYEDGGPASSSVAGLPDVEVEAFPSRSDLGRALDEQVVDLALVTVLDRALLEEQLGRDLALRARVPTRETTVLLLPLAAPVDLGAAVDHAIDTLRANGALDELAATWLAR